jgi:hypothetical protein
MPKITMMTSVSNEFPRSKNSIASKKFGKFLESALERVQGPKNVAITASGEK